MPTFPDKGKNNRAGVELTDPVPQEVQDDAVESAVDGLEALQGIANSHLSLLANKGNVPAGAATYSASGANYGGYATPTDMLAIFGVADRTVAVTNVAIWVQQTTPAAQIIDFVKRSTANSGGAPTNPTAMAYDSLQAAAGATVYLYTSAPSTGTLVGARTFLSSAAGTGLAPAPLALTSQNNAFPYPIAANDIRRPILLRGTGEGFAVNYRGAALPAGFNMFWFIEWVEF